MNLNQNIRVTAASSSPGRTRVGQTISRNTTTNTIQVNNLAKKSSPMKLNSITQRKPSNVKVVTYDAPANKISGYTPLMMQGSIAPQNRLSTAIVTGSQPEILHPKASTFQPKSSQYRQARDLLLQPGFEAQAQTQNIKQSQYHKYTADFKNQQDDVKIGQADLNIQNYQNYNINNMAGPINTHGAY